MKLYEVRTTEYNGEQEYSFSHLLAARDLDHARKIARKYFEHWYEDGESKHSEKDEPDNFEFVGGSIILRIKGVFETTLEKWLNEQIELYRVTKLPKEKSHCKKCKRLSEACEYILHCLDVGGEQSRQFAEEITYLKTILKEARK